MAILSLLEVLNEQRTFVLVILSRFTQEVSNILVGHTVVEDSFVPLSPDPIVYQIHVPTYVQENMDPLHTIRTRLETMLLIGVNAIELNGVEFLNCDEDKATCWRIVLESI